MQLAIRQFDEIKLPFEGGAGAAELKQCPRCPTEGREGWRPLSEFGASRARKDGLNLYCRICTREKVSDFRRRREEYQRAREQAPVKPATAALSRYKLRHMQPAERVLTVLHFIGPLEFADLRRATRLTSQQLSDALPNVIGFGLPVVSKNGTGPRKYFLKPKTQLEKQIEARKAEEARERRDREMLALAQAGDEFIRLAAPSGRQGEAPPRTTTEETHPLSFSSISLLHPKMKGFRK